MNRHASMNRVYRLVWSHVRNTWVPVAETARGHRKASRGSATLAAASMAVALSVASPPSARAAPGGGKVVSGAGSIAQAGATTTISQSSQTLSLSWLSFNIATQEIVNFVQPSSSAVAVNRITGNSGSQILGHLNANGQVYLINPNGVVFGKGAQVNVGGLVASTLDLNDADFVGSTRSFSGSAAASIVNQGSITAASGGSVVLLGGHVTNQGQIVATLGTVALGAGSAMTLTFKGVALVSLAVDKSVLESAAENGGLLQADGGQVILTAGAKDAVLASVVNNTGVVEARTVASHGGTISLLGGTADGTVNVSGTLDASAAAGGNGGHIETSAARVEVAAGSSVTTAAPTGLYGSWLVGAKQLTVAASGGDISGATLSAALATTSVTLQGSGTTGANVTLDDAVTWKANTQLALSASNDVDVDATLTSTGAKAGLVIDANSVIGTQAASGKGVFTLGNNVAINLPNVSSSATTALVIDGTAYTVLNQLGSAGSTTGTDLQGIAGNLSGHYALGSNLDATPTGSWNAGAGFAPLGSSSTPFAGTFDGLGHTVSHLTIKLPGKDDVGLFGAVGGTGVVQNIGLVGGSVAGGTQVGALVGLNYGGYLQNDHASTAVSGVNDVGGLVGQNFGGFIDSELRGVIFNSSASGNVTGTQYVGGLVGFNQGTVSYSHAYGRVTGSNYVGGLVGFINGNYEEIGSVSTSYATGNVSGSNDVGGLAGGIGGGYGGSVFNSRATGNVSGVSDVGGLVGYNGGGQRAYGVSYGSIGTIVRSYATGNVTGSGQKVGGLVGFNQAVITTGHATGSVSGASEVGGLVGYNGGWNGDYHTAGQAGAVNQSYATGAVKGSGDDVGGLVGFNGGGNGSYGAVGLVGRSYATGSVAGAASVGGLVGYNGYGTRVSNSYARGSVSGTNSVGGLAGFNSGAGGIYGDVGLITTSYAVGKVSTTGAAGGLVGSGGGTVTASFWDTTTSGLKASAGGIGLTTAQMQTQANFVSATAANGQVNPGWDFLNIWFTQGAHSYPLLTSGL